jgi:hypothetical protein
MPGSNITWHLMLQDLVVLLRLSHRAAEMSVEHVQVPNPYAAVWWTYIAACCIAWVSSAVFHSRDTKLTERFDYIAAIAVVFAGAALAAVRTTETTKCVSVINFQNWAKSQGCLHDPHNTARMDAQICFILKPLCHAKSVGAFRFSVSRDWW